MILDLYEWRISIDFLEMSHFIYHGVILPKSIILTIEGPIPAEEER